MVKIARVFHRLKIYSGCLLFSVFLSCHDQGILKTKIFTNISPFDIIELNSVFDVYLIQDTVYSIGIQGHEDIIDEVIFKIDTGILRIVNNASAKWMKPGKNKVALFIHSNELRAVWPNETCAISTVNPIISEEFSIIMGHHPKLSQINLELDCNSFYYWNNHQCGGKVTLAGNTQALTIHSYGLMTVDARDLMASNARVDNNSKGDVQVRVQDKLQYNIRGVGNIYLYGNTNEILPGEITSTGKLIEMK